MDHRPERKTQNYKTFRIRENLGDPGFGNKFLDTIPKALSRQEKNWYVGLH